MQHRLGPDDDVGVGDLGGRGVDVDDPCRRASARPARPARGARRRAGTRSRAAAARRARPRGRSAAASQRSSVADTRSQTSSRNRPRRFNTQTAGPRGVMQRIGERPRDSNPAPGGSSRRSTTWTRGHPPARRRGGGTSTASPAGEHRLDGRRRRAHRERTPARAARSRSTSRACHVGARSSWSASSASSTTTAAAEVGHRCERRDPPAHDDASRPPRPRPRLACAPRRAASECISATGASVDRGTRRAPATGPRRRRTRSSTRRAQQPRDERAAGRATAATARPPPAACHPFARHRVRQSRRSSPGDRAAAAPRPNGGWDEVRAATRSGGRRRGARHHRCGHPRRQRDDLGRRPGRHHRQHGEQRRVSASGSTSIADDPAPHPPAVQRHAHDRADRHASSSIV